MGCGSSHLGERKVSGASSASSGLKAITFKRKGSSPAGDGEYGDDIDVEVFHPDPDFGWRRVVERTEDVGCAALIVGGASKKRTATWPSPLQPCTYFNVKSGQTCSVNLLTLSLNIAVRAQLLAKRFGVSVVSEAGSCSPASSAARRGVGGDGDSNSATATECESVTTMPSSGESYHAPQQHHHHQHEQQQEQHHSSPPTPTPSHTPTPPPPHSTTICTDRIASIPCLGYPTERRSVSDEDTGNIQRTVYSALGVPDTGWSLIGPHKRSSRRSQATIFRKGARGGAAEMMPPPSSKATPRGEGVGGVRRTYSGQLRARIRAVLQGGCGDDDHSQWCSEEEIMRVKMRRRGGQVVTILTDPGDVAMNVHDQLFRLEGRANKAESHFLPLDTFGWTVDLVHQFGHRACKSELCMGAAMGSPPPRRRTKRSTNNTGLPVRSPDGEVFTLVPEELVLNVMSWVAATYQTPTSLGFRPF